MLPYPAALLTNQQLRMSSNLGSFITRFTNSIDLHRLQDNKPNNLEIEMRINNAFKLATLGEYKWTDFTHRIPDDILKLWPEDQRNPVLNLGLKQAGSYLETEDHYIFILLNLPTDNTATYFETVVRYQKKTNEKDHLGCRP